MNEAPKNSVVVFGPQGCGKTTVAEQLKEYFGCSEVNDDEWDGCTPLREGVLVLTNVAPPYVVPVERVIDFKSAMAEIQDVVGHGDT
ncbi:MAG: ATP-binding protein [Candidatus Thiodiazotropha sp. (ex Troendleina suluensis)]|nr:ATP-binding protein [Candidatus Thiodiazotropha sp. (ex Troendleina suluensis)]